MSSDPILTALEAAPWEADRAEALDIQCTGLAAAWCSIECSQPAPADSVLVPYMQVLGSHRAHA
jgi:hypothetical protein